MLGLPLGIHISAANETDGKQGVELLWQIDEASPRIATICTVNLGFAPCLKKFVIKK